MIPRTLVLVGEGTSASHQYRVDWPCKALSNRGYIADWCLAQQINGLLGLIDAGRYNIVLTPRAHWTTSEEGDAWVNVMRGGGLSWIYELDDDGWTPGIAERQSRLFETEWRKGQERLEWERLERIRLIQLADGVIVSSEQLANVARSYTTKPVYCVPNLIDIDWFAGRQSDAKRIVPPLTIGWSGGERDENDLEHVASAWHRIAERYPTVKFVVHGVHPKILTNAVTSDRVIKLNWSSLPDYPRALMNIDIACCAVASGSDFNLAKTPIKWYETTLSGSTCVVSDTLYGQHVHDGFDALVAETPDQWESAISKLIENTSLRKRLHTHARKNVEQKHSLQYNWSIWLEALAGTLQSSKQEVLHAA